MSDEREYSPKRFAISSVSCPSCQAKLERESGWCATCGFTGEKSLQIFGDSPPPLLPILDVADLWDKKETRKIESGMERLEKRFPQLKWRVCAVALPPETSLPLFGFWLMNVCPVGPEETAEDREWTVLLVIDTGARRASVTTGYRAEPWLSDEMWTMALGRMSGPFREGRAADAVTAFLEASGKQLENACQRARKQLEQAKAS